MFFFLYRSRSLDLSTALWLLFQQPGTEALGGKGQRLLCVHSGQPHGVGCGKQQLPRRPGILFGIGLLGIFLTRFFIEFIKTEQEAFEQGWLLDMGQWLSIPFILLGIYMIYRGATQPEVVPVVPKSPVATAKKKKK